MSDEALMLAVGNAAVTSNRHRKAKLIMDLLQHVTAANAKDVFLALGVAQDSGSEISQEIWDNVWNRWGTVDGPAALSFLTEHMKHSSDMDAVTAAEAMLAVDRQGLADWLAANQATAGDNKYWMAAFATLHTADASTDLQGATQHMLAEADSPELRRRCFQSLCDQAVLSGSISGLTDYFGTVPEDFRVDAFGSTHWRLIIADPTAARDWYSSQADKSWKDDAHTPHMVNLLADEDAPGTAQWAATLPLTPASDDTRRTPIYISAQAWAGRDPAATAAWIITNKSQPWAGIAAQAAIAKASNNLDPQVTLTLREIAKP